MLVTFTPQKYKTIVSNAQWNIIYQTWKWRKIGRPICNVSICLRGVWIPKLWWAETSQMSNNVHLCSAVQPTIYSLAASCFMNKFLGYCAVFLFYLGFLLITVISVLICGCGSVANLCWLEFAPDYQLDCVRLK